MKIIFGRFVFGFMILIVVYNIFFLLSLFISLFRLLFVELELVEKLRK